MNRVSTKTRWITFVLVFTLAIFLLLVVPAFSILEQAPGTETLPTTPTTANPTVSAGQIGTQITHTVSYGQALTDLYYNYKSKTPLWEYGVRDCFDIAIYSIAQAMDGKTMLPAVISNSGNTIMNRAKLGLDEEHVISSISDYQEGDILNWGCNSRGKPTNDGHWGVVFRDRDNTLKIFDFTDEHGLKLRELDWHLHCGDPVRAFRNPKMAGTFTGTTLQQYQCPDGYEILKGQVALPAQQPPSSTQSPSSASSEPKPAGEPNYNANGEKNLLVTHYYTACQDDKKFGGDWNNFVGLKTGGVLMQGSGVSNDGRICRAVQKKDRSWAVECSTLDSTDPYAWSNGLVYPGKTLAGFANKDTKGDKGKTIYLNYGANDPWTGCYKITDTGGAFGWANNRLYNEDGTPNPYTPSSSDPYPTRKLDLYVGKCDAALEATEHLTSFPEVYLTQCTPGEKDIGNIAPTQSPKDQVILPDGTICVPVGAQQTVSSIRHLLQTFRKSGGMIGQYKVIPAFTSVINYNLDIYDHIRWQLSKKNTNNIIDSCLNAQDVRSCINTSMEEVNGNNTEQGIPYTWAMDNDCPYDKDYLSQANSFLSKVTDCYESDNTDCYCEIKKEDTLLKTFEVKFERIDPTDQNSNYRASVIKQVLTKTSGIKLYTDQYEFKGPLCDIYRDNVASPPEVYTDKQNIVIQPRSDGTFELGYPNHDLYTNVGTSIYLLKHDGQMCFSSFGMSLALGTPPFERFENAAKVILGTDSQIPACKTTKVKVRFCVKDTSRKMMQYDDLKDKVTFENPEVRFAITIRDRSPPSPVTEIEANNMPKSEGTALITFTEPNDTSIRSYHAYAIPYSSVGDVTGLLQLEGRSPTISEKSVDLGERSADPSGNDKLEEGVLYNYTIKTTDSMVKRHAILVSGMKNSNVDPLYKELKYYICVNGVDDYGNEGSTCSVDDPNYSKIVGVSPEDHLFAKPISSLTLVQDNGNIQISWDDVTSYEDDTPIIGNAQRGYMVFKLHFATLQSAQAFVQTKDYGEFLTSAKFERPLDTNLPQVHLLTPIGEVPTSTSFTPDEGDGYYLFAVSVPDYADNGYMTYSDIVSVKTDAAGMKFTFSDGKELPAPSLSSEGDSEEVPQEQLA